MPIIIKNSVSMLLTFDILRDNGSYDTIRLVEGSEVPNVENPEVIEDQNLTPYVRNLARKGVIELVSS